jgi:tripartite-type tricarboxylate transporter receptor subunit TctC
VASTPEEFTKLIKEELALYAKVIKDANIRVE